MHAAHLQALKNRHEKLEHSIHQEAKNPAHDYFLIEDLKKEKLRLKEEIERLQKEE